MACDPTSYEAAKRLAADPDPQVRTALAASRDVAPEILYFLARDPAVAVRRRVAANPATPSQADRLLARDENYSVRCRLARKIAGDGLSEAERSALWRTGFTILETLANDSVVRVRRVLALALKGLGDAPRDIVTRLAGDPSPAVAGPLLQHSPVLEEADLLRMVAAGAPDWAQQAMARRARVPEALAEAILGAGLPAAVACVLDNPGAAISSAASHGTSSRDATLARRLGDMVSQPLLALLRQRDDPGGPGTPDDGTAAETADSGSERACRLHREERLDERAVLAELGDSDPSFVVMALALRGGLSFDHARRVLASGSAKAITALAWQAGLSMRTAMKLQIAPGGVPPSAVLNARDGTDFPQSEEEMRWHLSFFAE